jgi:hypothetical protein
MRRLVALAALLVLTTACGPENVLSVVPNKAPIAIALFWEGETIESSKRLGYTLVDETATLDGSLSFDEDPRGDLQFEWTLLAAPEGSEVVSLDVPEDDPDTDDVESAYATFVPDVLGTYRVELIVFDTREGVSRPAIVNVQAVPPSQLTVTLQWDAGGADLDLHLIQQDGTYFDYTGGSDCFSWSRNPDWGDPESAADNPLLDRDRDGERAGPYREIITLTEPMDGDYRILVHYFMDHVKSDGGNSQTTDATIDVKVLGRPLAPQIATPTPMQEGDVWEVRELSWPGRALSTRGTSYTTHEALGGPLYND